MKLKRIMPLMLSAVMVFSLAACTPESPPLTPPDEPQPDIFIDPNANNGEDGGNGEVDVNDEDALYDGKLVIDDHFEDDEESQWGQYVNGGSFTLSKENGEMVIAIDKPGNLDYSCQVFRDGYELNMGGVYDVSFDISCDIERPMQWRFQLNGGDYHAYYEEDYVPIGPEKKTITAQFTMNEATDPAPRFCFNLGLFDGMDNTLSHTVKIDNFVLKLSDASQAQAVEPLADAIALKVNQVGYKPGDIKKVVATTGSAVSAFDICDAASGKVVYSGKFDTTAVPSNCGDGDTYTGDFSDFKDAGTYYISVSGLDDSYQFTIADDVYDNIAKEAVRMLYLQRCGCEVTSELGGDFAHPECHAEDARIYGTETFIDVKGGWHDAGDYGRYVVAGAKTIADLFLTYEESEASRGDDYDIPESGNGIPDILDEARYELDFFLKMQADNGGVYHKVTTAVFGEVCMPEEETEELIVSPVSNTATGDFAAVMAKASIIYKEYDPEFAGKCLAAAKKAYKYLEANADADHEGFKNPEDVTTGEYPDGKNSDEFIWAAVELYIATGDQQYHEKAKVIGDSLFKVGLGWADMGTYAIYDYLKNPDIAKDDTLTAQLTEKITENAEITLKKSKTDPYFSSLRTYPWGSNMSIANAGILYRMMYNLTGDETYNEYARYQIDYLLGVNPTGYCYVTGEGTLSPEHVHHRPSQFVGKSMPGMLVGGPNSAPEDPYAKTVLQDREGGCCYVDNDTAYSVNEITIYWNSPLIYLLQIYR